MPVFFVIGLNLTERCVTCRMAAITGIIILVTTHYCQVDTNHFEDIPHLRVPDCWISHIDLLTSYNFNSSNNGDMSCYSKT